MQQKVGLITRNTGQEVGYLANVLFAKNNIAHGIKRRLSSVSPARRKQMDQDPQDAAPGLVLPDAELTDGSNLMAQSHVAVSVEAPCYPRYFRPAAVDTLCRGVNKTRRQRGWQPRVRLNESADGMTLAGWQAAQKPLLVRPQGYLHE